MNRWQCDRHGCTVEAVGVGAGIGLRAIGWWCEPGSPVLLCPVHRPDPVPCSQKDNADNAGKTCGLCAAQQEAEHHQVSIRQSLCL